MKSLIASLLVIIFLFLNFNSVKAEECYLKVIDYLPIPEVVGISTDRYYCPREKNYCYSYFGPADRTTALDEYLKLLRGSIVGMMIISKVVCDDGLSPKELKEIEENGALEFEIVQALRIETEKALEQSGDDTK